MFDKIDDAHDFITCSIKLKYFLFHIIQYRPRTNERTNELDEMETTTVAVAVAKKDMSAARRGAALKREKKIAAGLARAAGQAAAARRRAADAEDKTVRQRAIAEEAALVDQQIAAVRRALGLGDNEPNPSYICLMIETLMAEMRFRLSEKGFW